MPELDRLVIVKILRPDRLTAALSHFVAGVIGLQYITSQSFSLERSFQASSHPDSLSNISLPSRMAAYKQDAWLQE